MRAGNGLWKLSSCCAALAVVAMGSMAFGVPTGELRPVNNGFSRGGTNAPVIAGATIVGNKITLTAGGVNVEMELLVSDWGSAPGAPTLGAAQLTVDSLSYLGSAATPAQAGADLNPDGNPGTRSLGGFITQSTCSGNGRDCTTGFPGCVGPEGFCVSNPRWVVGANNPLAVLSLVGLNYEYGGVAQTGSVPNTTTPSVNGYLGTLILNVPATAATTYTVTLFNDAGSNYGFFNDATGLLIPGLVLVPGQIEIVTGRCCYNLGEVPAPCIENVTAAQCAAQPTSNARDFSAGQTCASDPCPACVNDTQCNDSNLCTSEVCTNFVCIYTNLYNTVTQCCNPATGGTTLINDSDPCTGDVCDAGTGVVAHNPLTGNACDDGFDCTVNDVCDAGLCAGTDVNTIPCLVDADCPLGTCGTAVAGLCECSESTPLCVDWFIQGTHVDDNCFDAGSVVTAHIAMGAGSQNVTGGQFRMVYDNTCLDFTGVGPCPGDTLFTNVIQASVNEATGVVFYAVTLNPNTIVLGGPNGTAGPYNLGCMTFIKSADCDACNICFSDVNPQNTILTNDGGNRVPLDNCICSKDIRTAGVVTLNTPAGAAVNADCGQPYATVSWATPSASDTCDGVLELDCAGQSVGGFPVGGLINNGGVFPQGKNFFTCTATNTCGDFVTHVWTVNVSDQQTLDVQVHLQPLINNAGVINRAITFELYNDCASDPVVECVVMQFQGPFNFPGHGSATLKVDKGNFLCMTARDNLHTLRSIVGQGDLACINNHWTAVFKGDPIQGGNWLIGGNLDAKKADATYGDVNTINILDFGMFMFELANGSSYEPNGDTTCTTASPHGDINADGAVDNLDYAFLVENFLKNSKNLCCPGAAGLNAEYNPLTEISVKELRRIGYGAAVVADLNKDGLVNLADMNAYMNGVMPVAQVKPIREDKGRGTR